MTRSITAENSLTASGTAVMWVGRVLSGIVLLFLLGDGIAKLPPLQPVTDTMASLGWPADPIVARGLGVLLLVIAGLYAWPHTAIVGAILLTGYLGGAVATHARIGSPLFTHELFGVYVGAIAWVALSIRDPRLRSALFRT